MTPVEAGDVLVAGVIYDQHAPRDCTDTSPLPRTRMARSASGISTIHNERTDAFGRATFKQEEIVKTIGGSVMTEVEFRTFQRVTARDIVVQIAEDMRLVDDPQITQQRSGGSHNHAYDSTVWDGRRSDPVRPARLFFWRGTEGRLADGLAMPVRLNSLPTSDYQDCPA